MSTLAIKYTPRVGSRTAKIFDAYIAGLEDVVVRDISNVSLPNITPEVMAEFMSENKTTEFGALSAEITAELKKADKIIIATPIYNFGLPAQFKSYIDLASIAGQTFEYTAQGPSGLLDIKEATMISTSGGVPFGSPADLLTPAINIIINFWAKGNVELKKITVEGLNAGSEEEADQRVADLIATL